MALNITVSFDFGGPDVNYTTTSDDTKGLSHWMHMFYTQGWMDVIKVMDGKHYMINYSSVQKVVLT